MKPLRTLVVDDEPLAREGLRDYVLDVNFLKLAGTATDALEALKFINGLGVDLLLLDINMPKINGVDFLKTLTRPPLVIFTTAYPNYALEGYRLDVVDYLVKPITFTRFLTAAQKARRRFEAEQIPPAAVPAPRATPVADDAHFFVKCDGRMEKIFHRELLFVEGMQNYARLYTDRGQFVALLPLKNLETELPAPRFRRVHKSYLANLSRVRTLEGNELLIGEFRIPVSRRSVGEVQRLILGGRLLE